MPVLTFEIIMLCLMTVAFIAVSIHYVRLLRQLRGVKLMARFHLHNAARYCLALDDVASELDSLDGKGGGDPAFYGERIREIMRKRKESSP